MTTTTTTTTATNYLIPIPPRLLAERHAPKKNPSRNSFFRVSSRGHTRVGYFQQQAPVRLVLGHWVHLFETLWRSTKSLVWFQQKEQEHEQERQQQRQRQRQRRQQ